MSKITGSFLTLVFIVVLSSIVYIWRADAQKRELETKITSQQEQIYTLETQLQQSAGILNGEVQGAATSTGKLLGLVTIANAKNLQTVLVCVLEINTNQEMCTDFNFEPSKTEYPFEFDIPQGTYEVYTLTPPIETKIYYSDESCTPDGDCSLNAEKRKLIQVMPDTTPPTIQLYL